LGRLDRIHRLRRSRADIVIAISLPAITRPAVAASLIAAPIAAILLRLCRRLGHRLGRAKRAARAAITTIASRLRHRDRGALRLWRRRTGTAVAAITLLPPEFVAGILVLGIGGGRHRRDCGGGQQSCPHAFHLVSPLCGKRACPSLIAL
jgi:hypothetical protein